MNKITEIQPWDVADVGDAFDLLLAVVGYEQRARFVSESVRPIALRCAAYEFVGQKVKSYRSNLRWFRRAGFQVSDVDDAGFQKACELLLSSTPSHEGRPLRVCVDISSMSRVRIAAALAAIADASGHRSILVDFVYAVAKYVPPPREMSQIVSAGPVLPRYAGWSTEPDRPVAAVFGLGYEHDKAVGALEFIEPAQVWGFRAISQDGRYDEESQRANRFFWKLLPEACRIQYRVDRPFDCFVSLESLIFGLLKQSRPVLIPFGPKIFTLCCLLTATVHQPRVAVWRVSSGENEPAVDRAAAGSVLGLRVGFRQCGPSGADTMHA